LLKDETLIDRFQSLWVKKYWIDKVPFGKWTPTRKCLFISVGATSGKKLFDGALYTMKYFCDTLDMEMWRTLLYRGLDGPKDAQNYSDYLQEARDAGRDLAVSLT